MQPSFSGLLVTYAGHELGKDTRQSASRTCAYLPHTTLPPVVTSPSSLTLTCDRVIAERMYYDAGIYLKNGSLCDDAELGEERAAWILLHADDGQRERGLELRCKH